MRINSIAIRCHSYGGISHRKCAYVSHYAPHVDWCCHVCNYNIPSSNNTNYTNNNTTSNNNLKNSVCPACHGRWLTIGPHLSAPNVRENSISNLLHKQGLPWSSFEAPTAGPARLVYLPITVGQPNSRTEHHRSSKTPLKS